MCLSYLCLLILIFLFFFFSSRRRHTRLVSDWSSDVCSSDLVCHLWNRGINVHAVLAGPEMANFRDFWSGFEKSSSRSEERRVGKEGRFRWSADYLKRRG